MSRLLRSLMAGRYMAPAGDGGSDAGGTDTATVTAEEELDEGLEANGGGDSSVLDLSDDEVMKMSAPPVPKAAAVAAATTEKPTIGDGDPDIGGGETASLASTTQAQGGDEDDLDPEDPDKGGDIKATTDPKAAATDKPAGTAGEAGKGAQAGADGADGDGKPAADKPVVAPTAEEAAAQAAAVKAFFDKVTAPFKANGREIKVESAEDAIQLMQMGANYNKRMAAIKPHLKIVRMLENNGLLNEEQLSFLIDVSKKDKAAISKLVKESGIDPMDLSSDKASEYTPGSHAVSDTEVALDTVFEEVKDTYPDRYNQVLEVASSKWDAASKQAIAASPQVLKVIAAHMDAGIYDLITKEVEKERLFGRLSGLPDIEAYRKVGDDMFAKGRFAHIGAGSSQAGGASQPSTKVVVEPPKKADDKDRNDKRRAASPAKPSPGPSTRPADFNPLNMSDEEIEKMGNAKFL